MTTSKINILASVIEGRSNFAFIRDRMACVLQAVCRPLDMAALAQWMVIVHVLVGILAAVAHESLPLLVRRTAASLPSQKRCASRKSLTFRGDGLFSLNLSQNA